MCPFGPSHVFLEFRPYNSVAVYGPEQINADDDDFVVCKFINWGSGVEIFNVTFAFTFYQVKSGRLHPYWFVKAVVLGNAFSRDVFTTCIIIFVQENLV